MPRIQALRSLSSIALSLFFLLAASVTGAQGQSGDRGADQEPRGAAASSDTPPVDAAEQAGEESQVSEDSAQALIRALDERTKVLTLKVSTDDRWQLEDELMVQVFGMTLYGFAVGAGRLVYFLDMPEIATIVEARLVELGIGRRYVRGLVERAAEAFAESSSSHHSQLVGIGYSHYASESLDSLVDSVFANTNALREIE